VATTAAAALVLKSKQAGLIAVGLAVMMCNPGSIQKAAEEWLDDGQGIIETVRTELTKLRNDAKANDYWGGNNEGAFSRYSDATDALDKLLAEHEKKCKGSGGSLQQSAHHGHGLTLFADSVGGTMGTLMLLSLGGRLLPWQAQLAIGLAIHGITQKINSIVMSVLKKAGLATVVVADIFATANFSFGSMVSELEKLKKDPGFAKTEMKYVKKVGLTMSNSEMNV
jgi:hypothetical protein